MTPTFKKEGISINRGFQLLGFVKNREFKILGIVIIFALVMIALSVSLTYLLSLVLPVPRTIDTVNLVATSIFGSAVALDVLVRFSEEPKISK